MIAGEQTIEIQAPLETVFNVLADLERYPDWQGFLRRVTVRERDGEGRAALADAEADARVTSLRLLLRCSYAEPRRVTWRSEDGDVKALSGEFELTEAGYARTRTTFRLEVDPGRKLGFLLRGGAADRIRDRVLGGILDGLRQRAESTAR